MQSNGCQNIHFNSRDWLFLPVFLKIKIELKLWYYELFSDTLFSLLCASYIFGFVEKQILHLSHLSWEAAESSPLEVSGSASGLPWKPELMTWSPDNPGQGQAVQRLSCAIVNISLFSNCRHEHRGPHDPPRALPHHHLARDRGRDPGQAGALDLLRAHPPGRAAAIFQDHPGQVLPYLRLQR